jgi:cell division protein FtsX
VTRRQRDWLTIITVILVGVMLGLVGGYLLTVWLARQGWPP